MTAQDLPSALPLITSSRRFLDSEQRIVDLILANPDRAPQMTSAQLARASSTSERPCPASAGSSALRISARSSFPLPATSLSRTMSRSRARSRSATSPNRSRTSKTPSSSRSPRRSTRSMRRPCAAWSTCSRMRASSCSPRWATPTPWRSTPRSNSASSASGAWRTRSRRARPRSPSPCARTTCSS